MIDPDTSSNPFSQLRGTKPWVLDRIVNPPPRYFQAKAPPLIPPFFTRWVVVRMSLLLLATCTLLFWWQSNPFGVGLATGTADVSCATLSTSTPQAVAKPYSPRSLPTLTASGNAVTPPPQLAKPTAAPPASGTKYEVKSGDSLWIIANKYKVSVDELRAANGLTGNMLHVGDQLTIPTKSQ